MSRVSHAIFGVADGLTSLVGVLAGLLVAHATPTTILTTTGGLAVAGGVGMASGDWLAGARRMETLAMGVATLVGSLLPALPIVLVGGTGGYAIAGGVAIGTAVLVAETRYRSAHVEPITRLRAYTTTGVILAGASALAAAAALLLGAA